jgi:tRNA(Phe) wybutosine-synthesizing methylase Tyw3
LTSDKNVIVELNSSERLEFPVIKNGNILVGDEFLNLIVKISNEKLEKSWEKIKKLEKVV